ncbi:uncharacterized protein LOC128667552 [Microplitis demolitor]|uniref:uncharacterized protein LOC128667552 n=1 Tax=Microplitis demolitor TaxID=69319 RepID=UPI00235B685C|nr:uncharacterized protein LOC128667552 [Microplitis demolitor]
MVIRIIWCLLLVGVVAANQNSTTTPSTISAPSGSKTSGIKATKLPKNKVRRSNYYLSNGVKISSPSSFSPFETSLNSHAVRSASFSNSFPKSDFTKSPLIKAFTPHYEINSLKLIPETSQVSKAYFKNFAASAKKAPILYTSSNSFPKFEEGQLSKFSSRPVSGSVGQYAKDYLETKSISASPSFETPELTSGGFKPISPPQFQSNPKLSGALRTYDETYQSYGNPTGFSIVSSVENFQAYPPISPTIITNLAHSPSTAALKTRSHDNYQLLSAQPQLHFHTAIPQPVYHSQPFGRIKSDVEVIGKKPQMPFPDDDSEEDFKPVEIPASGESFEQLQSVKTDQRNPFELPESSIFSSYDNAFGKLSQAPRIPIVHSVATLPSGSRPRELKVVEKPLRYGVTSSSENEKQVYEPSEEYSSDSNENYNHEENSNNNNEESQQKYSVERNNFERPHFQNFDHDFKQDFEESYQQELPHEEYKHVREVPGVDETNPKPKVAPTGRKSIKSRGRERYYSKQTKPREDHTGNESSNSETISYDSIVGKNNQDSTSQFPVENFGYKIPKISRTSNFNNEQTTEPSKATNSSKNSRNQASRNHELRKQTSKQFTAPSGQPKPLDGSPTVENVLVLPFYYHDNPQSNYRGLNDPDG